MSPRFWTRSEQWELIALTAVTIAAATAYAWDLDIQRWGNAYYSAIAQSGAESWRSFFFGSLDSANATASDKPPGAFWVMALSVRAFGLSSWSVMLPQSLETVATLVVLNRTVRRLSGPLPAVVATLVLATTPAALALARYNHPDTLMTLLVVGAAYCCVRAMPGDGRRWLVATGALLGLAFLSKWAVAFLPVPGMAGALVAARRRPLTVHLRRLGLVLMSSAITGMSWLVVVLALPPAARPYPDGSNGSILDLIVGRDGFSRLGGGLGAARGNPVSGSPGMFRLFEQPFSAQIAWLLPLAVFLLVAVTVKDRGRPSPGMVLFGGWLVATTVAFSAMSGAMHPYYTVLLAPAQAAVIGLGMSELRSHRLRWLGAGFSAATLIYDLGLARAYRLPAWLLWLAGCLALGALVTAALARTRPRPMPKAVASVLLGLALAVCPVAVGLETILHPVTGSDPLAGPHRSPLPSTYPADLITFLRTNQSEDAWLAAVPRATAASLMQLQGDEPVVPLGGFTGHSAAPTLSQVKKWVNADRLRYLVLSPGWANYPDDTPPALQHFAIASVLAWAAHTGCPHPWAGSEFVVLDLEEGQCSRNPSHVARAPHRRALGWVVRPSPGGTATSRLSADRVCCTDR